MTFGLTAQGFQIMRQSDIISQTQAQLQASFGVALNLLPQSVIGQILGITSEREALVWALAQAVYASQYPSGAEGTSVDNILALSNLKRLAATPTRTAPTDTAGIPGLVLLGVGGTVVPAGSIISVINMPTLQFTLDAAVTIAAAVNAIQLLVLSAAPDSGSFQFTIVDPAGNTLTSPSLPWNTPTATTQLSWTTPPTSGAFKLTLTSALGALSTASLPSTASAASIQTAIRGLNAAYSAVVVTGSVDGSVLATTGNVSNGSRTVTALASTTGLVVGMKVTGADIPSSTVIDNIVGNSVLLSNAATATVVGEALTFSGALTIAWGGASEPVVTLTANTLSPAAGVVFNSLQTAFNTLFDSSANNYPYTDVTCTGSLAAASVAINFGAGTGLTGQPVSSFQPQDTVDVTADTLQIGSTIVNTTVLTTGVGTAVGAPAQGIGSATCTVTGPNAVPATYLSVIGSPISGWASATNPLDCIAGTNTESDPAALTRRLEELSANANGPIVAIAEKVQEVPGVVQAIGFQNLSLAALQTLTFSAVPTSGSFSVLLNGGVGPLTSGLIDYRALANVQAIYFSGAPTGGSFTITMNGQTTAPILNTATNVQVQSAVRLLTGFSTAVVTGSFTLGFFLSFGAGSLQQYPVTTADSLTGASISATIPSVQAVINAVSGYGLATVIGSYAATMIVAFNGSTGGQPQQLITTPTNTLEVSSTPIVITPTFGRPGKSFEIVVNDDNGEASNLAIAEAIFNSAPAGIQSYGNQPAVTVFDNNVAPPAPYLIYFSRPTQIPIFVSVVLQTDLTTAASPLFNVNSIITLQEDIAAVINAFGVGGLVIGFGTNGIAGSFNSIPGISSYTLAFGTTASPTQDANIQMLPEQVPLGESFNVIVSYS